MILATPPTQLTELEFIVRQLTTINHQLSQEAKQLELRSKSPQNWLRNFIRDIRGRSLQVDKVVGQLYEEIGKLLGRLIDIKMESTVAKQQTLTTPTKL